MHDYYIIICKLFCHRWRSSLRMYCHSPTPGGTWFWFWSTKTRV